MHAILVIEDNSANLNLATVVLRKAGYAVLQAKTATLGLELAQRHRPDLILMDMQLPDLDGFEATRRLKSDAATRSIPVVALTALAMKGDADRMRAAGCDGYVAKPYHFRDLLAAVSRILAGSEDPTADNGRDS